MHEDLLLEEFIVQNVMSFSVIEQSFTIHGVEFEVNEDGSISFYNGEDKVFKNFKYEVPHVKYSAAFCKKDGKVSVSCFSITGIGDSEPGLSILLTKEGNYNGIGKFKNLLKPPFRFL